MTSTPDSNLEEELARLRLWQSLLAPEHAALRGLAAEIDPSSVQDIARLRKKASAELATTAIDLARARKKLAVKWPRHAEVMVADSDGVEQMSSQAVARFKAARFHAGDDVIDLCCGAGGDAMALVERGCAVIGVDRSLLRSWMTQQNAGCETIVSNAEDVDVMGRWVHIDPARRSGGRRLWTLEDILPNRQVLGGMLGQARGMCIKLGPGVDLGELAELLQAADQSEVQFMSEQGRLVQAVVWSNDFVSNLQSDGLSESANYRSAAMLVGDRVEVMRVGADELHEPDVLACGKYLYEADSALERGQMLSVWCRSVQALVGELHRGLGLLTSDALVDSPWVRGFQVEAVLPWRLPKVKQWMREHDAGIVEVKTRGKVVDPDVIQRELSGKGDERWTVFILRLGDTKQAFVTKRLAVSR